MHTSPPSVRQASQHGSTRMVLKDKQIREAQMFIQVKYGIIAFLKLLKTLIKTRFTLTVKVVAEYVFMAAEIPH